MLYIFLLIILLLIYFKIHSSAVANWSRFATSQKEYCAANPIKMSANVTFPVTPHHFVWPSPVINYDTGNQCIWLMSIWSIMVVCNLKLIEGWSCFKKNGLTCNLFLVRRVWIPVVMGIQIFYSCNYKFT